MCDCVLGECRWSLSLGNRDRGPLPPTPARETCPLFGGPRALSFTPGQGGRDPGLASLHLDAALRFYDVVSFCGSLPRQTEEYFLPRMIQEVTEQVSLGERNAVFSHVPPSKAGGGPRGRSLGVKVTEPSWLVEVIDAARGFCPSGGGARESPGRCSGPLSSGLAGGVPWGARRVSPATPHPAASCWGRCLGEPRGAKKPGLGLSCYKLTEDVTWLPVPSVNPQRWRPVPSLNPLARPRA